MHREGEGCGDGEGTSGNAGQDGAIAARTKVRWVGRAGVMLPGFLIVGTMKGGTSALMRGVREHPDVFTPGGKEMRYFDRNFDNGPGWYESKFEGAAPDAMAGEASPGYMYGGDTIERMTTTLPEARYVAILRNPVDRAYSHYWHNVRRQRDSRSFLEAIAAEPEILSSGDARSIDNFAYLDRGRYVTQLRQIEARAGRDRLLVLETDDLRHDRAGTLRTVWAFIGVDPQAGDVAVPTRRLSWHVRNRLSPRRRALNASYPPMDPDLRARLLIDAVPDIEGLEQWWGRYLPAWKPKTGG